MASEDWRKIDIDALTEAHLTEADLIPDLSPTSNETIVGISQQVRQYLSTGKYQEALSIALDNPPYVSDVQSKELHSRTVFEILCSIRNNHNLNQLTDFITKLNSEQQDTLIKYLYNNMSQDFGQKQGGLLLNWFEKTVEVTGLGPIARYLTDRRTV
ncbi:Actin-related protein 2/3 complex subunit 5 [Spathaspora sp. JA1]|nr:Actin-related protein 2/3 complex subunit 5 [Spathaspora sp. JA1]